jgi:hypothetical protein
MAPDPKFDKAIIEARAAREAEAAVAEDEAAVRMAAEEAPDLDAERILALDDRTVMRLWIPEWGGCVYLRQLAGWERDRFETAIHGRQGKVENVRARFAVLVCCTKEGAPLFTGDKLDALGKKNAKALDRIFDEGMRLNGIGERDVRDLEKNSGSARSAGNGSD